MEVESEKNYVEEMESLIKFICESDIQDIASKSKISKLSIAKLKDVAG